ncbi:hypothetical protein EDD15DRAFT_2199270 [Pisolithus albus]|nr:hypothetical protein EDD15DRAFT_2199270 [Pisolithus albus]
MPELSFQHSAQVTNEFTLLDPRVCESLYEKCFGRNSGSQRIQKGQRGRTIIFVTVVVVVIAYFADCCIPLSPSLSVALWPNVVSLNAIEILVLRVIRDPVRLPNNKECIHARNMLNSSHARATSQLLTPCHSSHTSVHQTMGLEVVAPRTGIMIYDHWVHEALYERLSSHGRPLSYTEILRRWTKAVIKRKRAVHSAEETQDEYEDSASDVIAVIGQEEYYKFLEVLSSALQKHWMVEVNEVV